MRVIPFNGQIIQTHAVTKTTNDVQNKHNIIDMIIIMG